MSLALYVNLTGASGASALAAKRSIRERLRQIGGTVTRIYRNPYGQEVVRYRFIRVHFNTEDKQ